MSYIPTPNRKQDFKVNKMSFWICEDPSYLLFLSPQWESQEYVSKIKITTITNDDNEIIRYMAFCLHPDQDTNFEYSDSDDENRVIFNKWNKYLTKIDKLLLS